MPTATFYDLYKSACCTNIRIYKLLPINNGSITIIIL